ncbi:MAG: hypothetical protein Q8O01_07720, partial [Candidatus Omnitrophota bacterium]|nr:hypothetical protein [Candidatus Omnitrophota bacterium]
MNKIRYALYARPLITIPYDGDNLPSINIGGKKVLVTAHSSQFANYQFVTRQFYNSRFLASGWDPKFVCEFIGGELMHEVGAFCGLEVIVKNGKAWNEVDEGVFALGHARLFTPSEKLKNMAPVNLLDLELRNDYAAGSIEKKKSVFKRAMLVVLAAVSAILSSCDKIEKPQDKETAKSQPQKQDKAVSAPAAAVQPYQFAHKYTIEGVVQNPKEAEAFIREYFKWEAEFYKKIRISGIAMDGFDLDKDTLSPLKMRDLTAASKECLDLAVQLKILTGNKYGVILTGQNDVDAARRMAINILKEKMDAYEEYNRSFPAFGGFLTWSTMRYGKIQPASDWSDRLPALDAGEWAWPIYTAYHILKNIGENDLAARYEKYFKMLVKNAPSIFYDTNLRKIRAEVKIQNPKAKSVDVRNYSNNTAGYYLDDCYEGMMMACFLASFTDLPQSEKDHIWSDINMEKITTAYGTTYKGWPLQSPLDGSPHTKWAFMFLPFTDNPIAMKVYQLQEKIRTNINKYGIPVSTNTPGAIGYTAYEPNVFGLYGPFSMIFGQTLQGDVTQNNYGLAWFLNVLQADKMQGPLGSGESLSVTPGTNKLEEISAIVTVDGKLLLSLAMMGGIQNETREALKADGLYDRFMTPVHRLYAATFGDAGSVQDNTQFHLPQKPIIGKYEPKVYEQMVEAIDLSTFWKYPATDKWGDKTAVRIDGNRMIIEHKPGAEGGSGWAGGSFISPLTPAKGSAIYLKGKGTFTLKLECENKEAIYIYVDMTREDRWTKVPLDTAAGKTFSVGVIDRITEDIVIADRYYSPDGQAPDKGIQPKNAPMQNSTKTTESEISAKQVRLDLMAMWDLSPDRHWGRALVSKSGNKLVVKHNKKDGFGWSWTGETLKRSCTLNKGERIRITGKGSFLLKLEGSETVENELKLSEAHPVIIDNLPAGMQIIKIIIDKVMPNATIEIKSIEIIGSKTQSNSMLDAKPAIPEHIQTQMNAIGATIPALSVLRFSASQRVDAITEILWQAGLGSMSATQAKEKLADLVPEAVKTAEERSRIYAAWISQAKTTMLAMSIRVNR